MGASRGARSSHAQSSSRVLRHQTGRQEALGRPCTEGYLSPRSCTLAYFLRLEQLVQQGGVKLHLPAETIGDAPDKSVLRLWALQQQHEPRDRSGAVEDDVDATGPRAARSVGQGRKRLRVYGNDFEFQEVGKRLKLRLTSPLGVLLDPSTVLVDRPAKQCF
eukprot:CAMPEP_0118982466 /NCGR_PEP_ID=MMETSP1173-20130426/32895_1 /TAXON_ID=1034831 /ORGANISM="Rhizochromulina marina cf, Strain CCMP1243" /LENGTH=161 /DNA_ID=CAMNT_0006932963 /DNA_START=213 /DNA_END=699 /DNA_ORIENTATION=+